MLHRGIGRLLDDGLRDLGVSVTALVQRGACACSDACRCCQLPAHALALSLDRLVLLLRQHIHTLRRSLCFLYSCTASSTACTNLFTSFTSTYTYLYYLYKYLFIYIYIHKYIYMHTISDYCFTADIYIICMHDMLMIYMYTYIYSYS